VNYKDEGGNDEEEPLQSVINTNFVAHHIDQMLSGEGVFIKLTSVLKLT
jgi:hypothetical protein